MRNKIGKLELIIDCKKKTQYLNFLDPLFNDYFPF
jgi:hypothetical protein